MALLQKIYESGRKAVSAGLAIAVLSSPLDSGYSYSQERSRVQKPAVAESYAQRKTLEYSFDYYLRAIGEKRAKDSGERLIPIKESWSQNSPESKAFMCELYKEANGESREIKEFESSINNFYKTLKKDNASLNPKKYHSLMPWMSDEDFDRLYEPEKYPELFPERALVFSYEFEQIITKRKQNELCTLKFNLIKSPESKKSGLAKTKKREPTAYEKKVAEDVGKAIGGTMVQLIESLFKK